MQLYGFDLEFVVDKDVEFLVPVLEQWVKINRDYIEQSDNRDNYYWFNERANLSALAGAVWKSGGFASEEYSARKGENNSSGRIDLFFQYAKHEVICEAKHDWMYLPQNKSKEYGDEIKKSLDHSVDDIIHTLGANNADVGLGLTFITPYWDARKPRPTKSIDELKQKLKGVDASFYIYLEDITNDPIIKGKDKDEAFSSIILVGKEVKPS